MKLSDCKDANFDLMGELAADVGVVLLTLLKHLLPVQLLDLGDVEYMKLCCALLVDTAASALVNEVVRWCTISEDVITL